MAETLVSEDIARLLAENANIVAAIIIIATGAAVSRTLKSYVYNRLVRKNKLSPSEAEAVHRTTTLLVLAVTILLAIYALTRLPEILYIIVVVVAAILFASWRHLADIVSYHVIVWQYSFRTGDYLEAPQLGIRGRVTSVTPFAVTIRDESGLVVIIPNHVLASQPIRHMSLAQMRVILEVTISIKPNIENGLVTIKEVEDKIREVLRERKLVPRASAASIILREIKPRRAVLQISVPLTGREPRPHTINDIVKEIARALSSYDPEVVARIPELPEA